MGPAQASRRYGVHTASSTGAYIALFRLCVGSGPEAVANYVAGASLCCQTSRYWQLVVKVRTKERTSDCECYCRCGIPAFEASASRLPEECALAAQASAACTSAAMPPPGHERDVVGQKSRDHEQKRGCGTCASQGRVPGGVRDGTHGWRPCAHWSKRCPASCSTRGSPNSRAASRSSALSFLRGGRRGSGGGPKGTGAHSPLQVRTLVPPTQGLHCRSQQGQQVPLRDVFSLRPLDALVLRAASNVLKREVRSFKADGGAALARGTCLGRSRYDDRRYL